MEQPEVQESDTQEQLEETPEVLLDANGEPIPATEEDPPEENEEIDVDGRKIALPKSVAEKLHSERLMHADYTRKTQEVAAERAAVEARATQVQAREAEAQTYVREIAQVVAIDTQLQELAKIDFNTLVQQNPQEALRLNHAIQQLQSAKNNIVSQVTQKQQQSQEQRQREDAKALQEGAGVLERDIPGWNDKKAQEIGAYAISKLGATSEQLRGLIKSPALIKALHKAMQFDSLSAKTIAKPKPAPQAAPVTRITAKQPGTVRDPDKLSNADWLKWRNGELKKRG